MLVSSVGCHRGGFRSHPDKEGCPGTFNCETPDAEKTEARDGAGLGHAVASPALEKTLTS